MADKSRFRPTPVPRSRRRKLLARTELVEAGGLRRSIVVENVSASGLLASTTDGVPTLGASVTITLPDGQTLWGVVRWTEGARFGVELAGPVHPVATVALPPR